MWTITLSNRNCRILQTCTSDEFGWRQMNRHWKSYGTALKGWYIKGPSKGPCNWFTALFVLKYILCWNAVIKFLLMIMLNLKGYPSSSISTYRKYAIKSHFNEHHVWSSCFLFHDNTDSNLFPNTILGSSRSCMTNVKSD